MFAATSGGVIGSEISGASPEGDFLRGLAIS